MECRYTAIEDYPELCTWWKFWRFPAPTIDMLPNNLKDGVMIYFNNQNACSGFLYRTPSSFCWFEFVISNPEIKDRKVRREALSLLINTITELAKELGFKTVYSSLNNQNLINTYLDCGFTKGSNAVEMIKAL